MVGSWGGLTSVQIKLDVRVLLPLVAVVMRSPLHHLHIAHLNRRIRALRGHEAAECDYRRNGKGHGREEAKDILQSHQCRVHPVDGRLFFGGVEFAGLLAGCR